MRIEPIEKIGDVHTYHQDFAALRLVKEQEAQAKEKFKSEVAPQSLKALGLGAHINTQA